MAIKLIGKSVLGELGFSQNTKVMGDKYKSQLGAILNSVEANGRQVHISTSMTGIEEREATNNEYFPKIRMFSNGLYPMFRPMEIYENCLEGLDPLRPACDFVIWDPKRDDISVITFSREAPVLAFESNSTGKKALGTILRPSLMKYGDYLFSTIKKALGEDTTVTLVTCNHFEYPEGSIPSIIHNLARKNGMLCFIGEDSESNPECYHRGEKGNHVVAMW